MKQVRRHVFETNSSSVHSISIDSGDVTLNHSMFNVDVSENKIMVWLHDFGWEWDSYYDQESKLSYLILMILNTSGIGEPWCYDESKFQSMIDELNENEEFQQLNRDIAQYTNTDGIAIQFSEGYIDHQSCEDFDSMKDFLNYYGVASAIDFVFSPDIGIHTGNDNEECFYDED